MEKMKVELEITEKMMEDAIKRFSTKPIWGDGALSKVVEEIVAVAAEQYVKQQLKENRELRIYLESTIQNSIHSAMQEAGKRIGEIIVDGIERGLGRTFEND